jgi:CubicO group peptidase (beta-lactamase class C family)
VGIVTPVPRTTPARPDPTLLDAAFSVMAEGVASGALPSGVLAVATGAETVRLEAFGPAAPDSIFLLASITKPIFATGLMRLVERGRLLLNTPVAQLVPEFARAGKGDVRLWHLLSHTSGLDEAWVLGQAGPAPRSPERLLALACAAPLQFRPGSRYAYCNATFAVLAELIRRLDGRDHATYLAEEVLEPLGMRETSYEPPASPRVAPVHDAPWGTDPAARAAWVAQHSPAGGLWSTAADVVTFGQMLLGGGERGGRRVLAPATLAAMTQLQTAGIPTSSPLGEVASAYGLGFSKAVMHGDNGPSRELRTASGFGHGGATGTYLLVEPELDLVVVFLTNRWGIDVPHQKRVFNAAIAAASVAWPGALTRA